MDCNSDGSFWNYDMDKLYNNVLLKKINHEKESFLPIITAHPVSFFGTD
jgi:hypothetical protein